jgi:hypothetical protein
VEKQSNKNKKKSMQTLSNSSTCVCQKSRWDGLSATGLGCFASVMHYLGLHLFMNDEMYDDEDMVFSALLGTGSLGGLEKKVRGQENWTAITNNDLYPAGMFTWLPRWTLINLPMF